MKKLAGGSGTPVKPLSFRNPEAGELLGERPITAERLGLRQIDGDHRLAKRNQFIYECADLVQAGVIAPKFKSKFDTYF